MDKVFSSSSGSQNICCGRLYIIFLLLLTKWWQIWQLKRTLVCDVMWCLSGSHLVPCGSPVGHMLAKPHSPLEAWGPLPSEHTCGRIIIVIIIIIIIIIMIMLVAGGQKSSFPCWLPATGSSQLPGFHPHSFLNALLPQGTLSPCSASNLSSSSAIRENSLLLKELMRLGKIHLENLLLKPPVP